MEFAFWVGMLSIIALGVVSISSRIEQKKWQKRFNAIQIGDRFIEKLNNPDPFKAQYSQIVEIKNKATISDGNMYLLYEIKSSFNTEESCTIQEFFEYHNYVPYNNQDKQL